MYPVDSFMYLEELPVPAAPLTPDQKAALGRAMDRLRIAYEARGERVPFARLAGHFDVSEHTVRSWISARRRVDPEIMRDLARGVALNPTELFVLAGWLEEAELSRSEAAAEPDRSADSAAEAWSARHGVAGHAVVHLLDQPELAARFTATVSKVVTRGRYPLATDTVVEFRPRPGFTPLPWAQARRQAQLENTEWEPDPELLRAYPDHCATALELMTAFNPALRDYGQFTWQGDPESAVWRETAAEWPAHLLVQDVVAGISRPAAPDPWLPDFVRPLLVIGGRYSSGLSAALLAQGLGWQFAVVHSGTVFGPRGEAGTVRRAHDSGPRLAWSDAAEHVRKRVRPGAQPWPCVLLVRPQSFLDPSGRPDEGALEQLRRTPARILYARPDRAHLDWWTARETNMSWRRSYAPDARRWLVRLLEAQRAIESVLRDRSGEALDDVRALPAPAAPLDPAAGHAAVLPPALVDGQARLAWQVVRRLSAVERHRGRPLAERLKPGPLASWRADLAADGTPLPSPLYPQP